MKNNKSNILFIITMSLMLISIILFIYYNNQQELIDKSSKPCAVSPYLANQTQEDSLGVKYVFDPVYMWKGRSEIKIYFLDANKELANKTLLIANSWLDETNVKFVKEENLAISDIRVAFRRGGGYKSLIGNEALQFKYSGLPTMWLDDLDKQPETVFKRTVLHEFGHSLGMLHELKNPNAKFNWNEDEVRSYFKGLKWKDSDIDKNILNPPPKRVISSSFDPNSIMIYQIPSKLLKDGQAILWPKGLSKDDKYIINKYY
ncbi:MAG: hypothetical protein GYB35_13995 [Algicola sp.]|nr:hypothetical protein [Algicola sp.]